MPGGPLFMKFLVLGTLIMGGLVLMSNILPLSRRQPRTRRPGGRGLKLLTVVAAATGQEEDPRPTPNPRPAGGRIRKTEEQWKAQLTEEQFRVTRRGETERPFTGRFWNHEDEGTYQCVGCGQDLFSSATKFDSGSGWPSFHRPVSPRAVQEIADISYGMVRTEIVCSCCEAHLGHVFADGPGPSGLRYCINSVALDFTGTGTHTDREDRAAGDRIASGQ